MNPCVDQGIVVKRKGCFAYVEHRRKDECGGCKACLFGRDKRSVLRVRNDCDANVGDTVRIIANESSARSLSAALLLFGLPLAFLLTGMLIAIGCGIRELYSFLIGLCAMAISILPIKLVDNHLSKSVNAVRIEQISSNIDAHETTREG